MDLPVQRRKKHLSPTDHLIKSNSAVCLKKRLTPVETLKKSHSSASLKKSDSTVSLSDLPNFLQDNEYLLDNHRPELNSTTECVKSVFFMHTETWNIWTHFIGTVGVAILSVYYLMLRSELWHHRLSMGIFFAGAFICMGCSTIYHTLICHSEAYCKFWAKMDYCGIVVLIVTSFAPWVHFGFYCTSYLKPLYLGLVFTLGLMAMAVVASDRFRGGEYRSLRAGVFIALGLTGVAPGLHYILVNDWWPHITFYSWLLFMALLYLTGGAIYALRIPERIWPGKFDIWCQSHQILHLCVMGGVVACYQGASRLADFRISVDPECPATVSGF